MHRGFGPHFGHGHRRGGWFMQPPIWGFMQPCLLLLLAEGPKHGYVLLEELRRRRLLEQEADVGNLYRALRRMEGAGLVTSRWSEGAAGPNKRVYEITPEGEQMLRQWAETLEDRLRLLNHFLDEYHQVTANAPTGDPLRGPREEDELL